MEDSCVITSEEEAAEVKNTTSLLIQYHKERLLSFLPLAFTHTFFSPNNNIITSHPLHYYSIDRKTIEHHTKGRRGRRVHQKGENVYSLKLCT